MVSLHCSTITALENDPDARAQRISPFLPPSLPPLGNSTAAVLKKTLANGCLAPFMISLHFSTITALENHPDARAHLEQRVSHNLLPTLASGVVFWPLINVLNFRFARLENRPVVGAMAGVAWSIYMSRQVNGKVGGKNAVDSSK